MSIVPLQAIIDCGEVFQGRLEVVKLKGSDVNATKGRRIVAEAGRKVWLDGQVGGRGAGEGEAQNTRGKEWERGGDKKHPDASHHVAFVIMYRGYSLGTLCVS